ncbi:hybrid sensor histidine kinase/response regulator transcription factor [Zobellia galactanivorans]|uniref:histidine kinase n=1 Tax=Zobellia galactanivorans (strain DSM 12802 / CCUG 47099 / CIP 106680 / NCIMB 13871 / Dsij) TaxID=63186 RepID=G0L4B0_ZOBGA|nr:hybrid sensor histidine kinase/response regulator transcription factor [Zobellia galactanivorans]CAZ95600.1 One-component system sensor protein [Zobellia galactanivorans]
MRFITKLCGVLLVLFSYSASAQYKPKVWDTRDGLSNNWISDITQDDKGYIWLATQYGLNRFDGYTFKSYTHSPDDSNSPIANWVKCIEKKSKDELWLGVAYGGLDRIDVEKNEFTHEAFVYENDTITSINKMTASTEGDLYIASEDGLFLKRQNKNTFDRIFEKRVIDITTNRSGQIFFLGRKEVYSYNDQTQSYTLLFENGGKRIEKSFFDSKNRLLVLEKNSLLVFEGSNGTYNISKRLKIDNLVSLFFANSPIIEDSDHRIWIGGENGISIVDENLDSVEFHSYESMFEKDMTGVQALSFFEDLHKNMWIGTNKGLALISTFTSRFHSSHLLPEGKNLNDIREFYQVGSTLLIASNEGLFSLDKKKRLQEILPKKIYGMHLSDDGRLFAIGNGLFEIDTASFKTKVLSASYFKGGWSITEDKTGDLWMISDESLVCYRKASDRFETYDIADIPTLKDIPRIDLLIDSKGRLWACTLKSGVYLLENPQRLKSGDTAAFRNINYVPGNENSLSNRLTTSLLEASDGTIWVGTDAGLNAIDPLSFEIKRYLKKDGLKDEKIMAMVEDNFGNIWGSTIGNGIFQLNQNTGVFNFFGQEDGLKSSNFLLSSVYKNHDGSLFFGTDNGIEIIDPSAFRDFERPKIDFFFTDTRLLSKSGEEQVRKLSPKHKDLVLTHNNNSVTVNYTTLNYHLAEKTTYKYKVDNLYDTWQDNGNERSVTFNSLPPGEYGLEVAAINPDLDFTNDIIRMTFVINPPWWKTNLAYASYVLLFISLLFAVHSYLLKRKLDLAEKNRLQELDSFKTSFFNNVAHELKTPLTIISGMANTLRKKGNKETAHFAKTISRNSNELNDLINQILDLSKLDAGKLELEMVHGDIIVYLKYISSSFESLAGAKEIRLHFLSEVETLYMDFDPQKIKHIFSNLISNAIKNTGIKGDIYLQIAQKDDKAEFVVKDNGIGISKEDSELIFDRYYQAKGQLAGTGIGLSFTKELVNLMKGAIKVESRLQVGSCFKITLPILNEASEQIPYDQEPKEYLVRNQPIQDCKGIDDQLPLIEIIEDNLDICSYLETILSQEYRLNFSQTGNSGWENVLESVPDLVITDLMMPGKDGFELCHAIKSNPVTNHIPVIMLTAKSDAQSKLEGLRLGADAYLKKPFDEKELIIRMAQLLQQREVLRDKYRNPVFWDGQNSKGAIETDAFVLKVRSIIEKNIDNSGFGILELCRELGISRSHLHRKLKALTGSSTSMFIQTVRLQKARLLLKTSQKNVSEVAYEVGFDDPAYFSRVFSKAFGHPPSETHKNL